MRLNIFALAAALAVCSTTFAHCSNTKSIAGPTAVSAGYRVDRPAEISSREAAPYPTSTDELKTPLRQDISEEMRRKLRHEFGFSFLVYRDKVQTELGLTLEQKQALDKYLQESAPADMEFLKQMEAHQGDFEAYRSKALDNLDSVLKDTLTEDQRKRLGELVRQREGLFGGPRLWTGLDITDAEKAQFMAIIEPMHQKMEAAAAQAEHGANLAEVQHKVLGLRADLESQMEAVLTDSQRSQWLQMRGKPVATEDLFDLSAD